MTESALQAEIDSLRTENNSLRTRNQQLEAEKELQSKSEKLPVTNILGIEEVMMFKDDGTVIHFNNPKVQPSVSANTFSLIGSGETKQLTEMLPGILNQVGAESLPRLKDVGVGEAGTSQSPSAQDRLLPGQEAGEIGVRQDPTAGCEQSNVIEQPQRHWFSVVSILGFFKKHQLIFKLLFTMFLILGTAHLTCRFIKKGPLMTVEYISLPLLFIATMYYVFDFVRAVVKLRKLNSTRLDGPELLWALVELCRY